LSCKNSVEELKDFFLNFSPAGVEISEVFLYTKMKIKSQIQKVLT